jgi:hypothetical protein
LRLHWLVNVIVAQAWQKDPLLAAETFVAAAMPSRAGFAANGASTREGCENIHER